MGRGRQRATAFAKRLSSRRRGTRYPSQWPDDRTLQRELEAFTAGRSFFPTQREFNRADRADLRAAVTDLGGTAYWAERLGLPIRSRQDKTPYTEADALRDAQRVITEHGRLPGVRKLRALGYARLASAVQAAGGASRFSLLHNLVRDH